MMTISLVSVAVAGLASFLFGWAWHGPLFGKKWLRLMNIDPESIKGQKMPMWPMVLGLLSYVVIALAFSWVLNLYMFYAVNTNVFIGAVKVALGVCVGFVSMITLGNVLWENKTWSLWSFNTAYNLFSFLVIGIVLALFV